MSKKSLARLLRILKGCIAEDSEAALLASGMTKLEKFAHFWVLVVRSFIRNRCPVRASALSYTTLLALIPLLAVAMSVTSMFLKSKGEDQIEIFIQEFVNSMAPGLGSETNATSGAAAPAPTSGPLTGQSSTLEEDRQPRNVAANPPASSSTNSLVGEAQSSAPAASISDADARVAAAQKKAASYIHEFIQKTYSGTLGVTGVIFLLWTAIAMLTRIEETFNDIWGVSRGRNWTSRVFVYWGTITLGPLLLVTAIGLAGGAHVQKARDLPVFAAFHAAVGSQVATVLVVALTFALFYKLIPNTRVQFSAALVGGLLAASAWHAFNLISLHVASRAVNASKIYGGLALVPLLMLGLYTVWVIVLFGAQVAYAFQNRESYAQEKLAENVNQRGREFIALRLMTCIGHRFHRGMAPPSAGELSNELGIPSRLAQQVLQTLLAARLVLEVSRGGPCYAPARPLESITAHHVLMAMRMAPGQELITRDQPDRAEVHDELSRIEEAERQRASAVTVLELVNRMQARAQLAPGGGEAGRLAALPSPGASAS